MDKKDWIKVLNIALDVGEGMLVSGGEVSRVEDTIYRICSSYGATRCDVFTVINFITITVSTESADTFTVTRRVKEYDTNLNKLEDLNAFSRQICANPDSPDKTREMLDNILKKTLPVRYVILGNMIACASFTVFFGGGVRDALCALVVAFIVSALTGFIKKFTINELLSTVAGSFVAGISVLLLTALGLGVNSDKIMIGAVLLFVPGIELTTSIRDLLWGDVISGTLKLVRSLLVATAIVFGFALAIILAGGVL